MKRVVIAVVIISTGLFKHLESRSAPLYEPISFLQPPSLLLTGHLQSDLNSQPDVDYLNYPIANSSQPSDNFHLDCYYLGDTDWSPVKWTIVEVKDEQGSEFRPYLGPLDASFQQMSDWCLNN